MRALVVDDDIAVGKLVAHWLTHMRAEVTIATSGGEALRLYDAGAFDLVLTDLLMPEIDGREVLRVVKERDQLCPVVVMTAVESTEMAVDVLRLGADDYLVKPFRQKQLLTRLATILEKAQRLSDARVLREGGDDGGELVRHGIVGNSPVVRNILSKVRLFARTDAPVLILGESGTGKERVAHAIHAESARAEAPFVAVNCGSVPVTLFESAFFGHRKGAFSDATRDQKGYFAEAEGGSLFLDEVGEMPLSAQAALLRTLQDKEYRPLGETRSFKANVRILAATNRDLLQEVARGTFREDLYYRLNVLSVVIPRLAEREGDIPLLVEHFVQHFAGEWGRVAPRVDGHAMALLAGYGWPGNIRELQNAVQRAVAMAEEGTIGVEHLPETVRGARGQAVFSAVRQSEVAGGVQTGATGAVGVMGDEETVVTRAGVFLGPPKEGFAAALGVEGATPAPTGLSGEAHTRRVAALIDRSLLRERYLEAKRRAVEDIERTYVLRLLAAHDGNISAAARAAGMDRKSYWRLVQKFK